MEKTVNRFYCFAILMCILVMFISLTGCDKKEELINNSKSDSNPTISEDTKRVQKNYSTNKKKKIDFPYIGMDARYIGDTELGEPDYPEPIGDFSAHGHYTFYISDNDDYDCILVTTERDSDNPNVEVIGSIQWFKDGKLIKSRSITGDHDPLFP